MKEVYGATLEMVDGRYYTRLPDLPGCVTSGDTLEEAYEMTVDVANLWIASALEMREEVPAPSPVDQIKVDTNEQMMLIHVDTEKYLQETDTVPVRRTVSLPSWMDKKAQRQGLSLSKVLRESLRAKFA